ncbi:M91 family zinc metallopeptidase [Catellatospora sichuanensis]|uniref:M91 family zinc metallopeptidase n=1 Tax=Catellatospora sichuanensis TaxID=1969805 RepID=UPI00118408DD|nr:M91 family zinc metallopeptidase [Catellatospora sichuanensis]
MKPEALPDAAPVLVMALPPLWSLPVREAPLLAAAQRWRSCAAVVVDTADGLAAATAPSAAWTGADATAYEDRRRQLATGVALAAELARRAALALETLAGRLASVQRHLDESLARVTAVVPCRGGSDRVLFFPLGPAHAARVHAAAAEAADLRGDLTTATRQAEADLAAVTAGWHELAGAFPPAVEPPTPEPSETVVVRGDGVTLVSTGANDDDVLVTLDAAGRPLVLVGGVTVAAVPDGRLVVRTGAGDDRVRVDPAVAAAVSVLAGGGDDRVDGGSLLHGAGGGDTLLGRNGDDLLLGGDGRDYLDAGAGADTADGGPGDDTVYGLSGDDTLRGGAGRDHLSGGRGGDLVTGGDGDDVLTGGAGADVLDGAVGLDRAYRDLADPAAEVESSHVAPQVAAGGGVEVTGTPEFAERVESDLDLLRASPAGRRMLAELDTALAGSDGWLPGDGPDTLEVRELPFGAANGFAGVDGDADRHVISYEPGYQGLPGEAPPVVVLYHELAHVWDDLAGHDHPGAHSRDDVMWDGDGWVPVPDRERVAVGLPIDDDGDPTTPERLDPHHPYPLTENALRDELGVSGRQTYGTPRRPA